MTRAVRFSPFFLLVALSPAFFQVEVTCEKTGDTDLATFELVTAGVNRVPAFDTAVRAYDVVTGGFPQMVVRATSVDPGAVVTWNMRGSGGPVGGYIGIGGGEVTLDWLGSGVDLFVFVKAPGGAAASYEFRLDPICSLGSCDDGDPCTDDVCDTLTAQCEFTPKAEGDTCDAGVPGPYTCVSGSCDPVGCVDDAGCDDANVCTTDACTVATGLCVHVDEPATMACGPGGGPPGAGSADQGFCGPGGSCDPNHLCVTDPDCTSAPPPPAEAQCTANYCDISGFASVCDFDNLADGTLCVLSGVDDGMCSAGVCTPCMETTTQDGDCTAAVCGDGTLNVTAGELCDDGNIVNDDGCNDDCTPGLVACDITEATCATGESCYPTASGDWCLPTGTATEGSVCALVNDCEAGLGCVSVPTDPVDTHCRTLCDADFGVACGGGDACIELTEMSEMGACLLDTCDLFAPTCPPGAGCYPTSAYGNICWFAGTSLPGAICTALTECVAGSVCASLNGGPLACFEMCDDVSSPVCSAGTVCTDQPGIPAYDACI